MLLTVVLAPQLALALERPPTSRADAVLGFLLSGPNYVIDPVVRSDGFMHVFRLRTRYGTYEVHGNHLIRVRVRELEALSRLEAMSQSDVFARAAGQAAAAPVRFVGQVLDDPTAAIESTTAGLANLFNQVDAAVSNGPSGRDSIEGSLLGVDTARRQLAYELGVDPYTDFAPLAARLTAVARAAAEGGLAIRALLMAVPGGAGTAIGIADTSNTARESLRDRTAAQIVAQVRASLRSLGVHDAAIERLVNNRRYSPSDLLLITSALSALNAGNTELFVLHAAGAVSDEEVDFHVRRAGMLAAHGRALQIAEFVSVGGFALNRTSDGRIVAAFPFDQLAWTESAANAFNAGTAALRRGGGPMAATLAVTGTVTPTAEREVTALGWTVTRLRSDQAP